jgi:hypothetical protein
MENFRQFCAAVVLILALVLSAFAGDIGTAGATAKPLPVQGFSTTGDILLQGTTAKDEMLTQGAYALDPATEAALSLLQSMMSLF